MQVEQHTPRKIPNIIVTGTPGTGKTTLCQLLNQSLNFKYLPIAKIINENKLYEDWNQQFNVPEFDEEKLVDYLSSNYDIAAGGLLFDFQNPEVFPKEYFDVIILLRCENETLYKRLEERGYNLKKSDKTSNAKFLQKIKYNIEEYFQNSIPVLELVNEKNEEVQKNLETVVNFLLEYKNNRQKEGI